MRMVRYHGKLIPVDSLRPDDLRNRGCPECGGRGEVPEEIRHSRDYVMAPCQRCQRFCWDCRQWVKKAGHTCNSGDI